MDLSTHATKSYLKIVTVIGTSDFAKKTNLANSKSDIHKLDIDKLKMYQIV